MFKWITFAIAISSLCLMSGCVNQPHRGHHETTLKLFKKNSSQSSISARDFHYWFQYYLDNCRPSDELSAAPGPQHDNLVIKEMVDTLCAPTGQDWGPLLIKLENQFAVKKGNANDDMLYSWLHHELEQRQQQAMERTQLAAEIQQCRTSQNRLQQTINELGKIEQQLNERQRESELN